MMNCLAVGLGGFAGAVLRYLIGLIPTGETMIFPVKTFCINVIGCIVIGVLSVWCDRSNHSTGGEIVCSAKDDFVSEGGSLRWIYHILNLCTGIFGSDPGWTYGNSSVLCIT
jgi:hypothetical protein